MEKGDETEDKKDQEREADNATPLITALIGVLLAWLIAAKSVSGNWDFFSLPDNWKPRLNLKVSIIYVLWIITQGLIYLMPIGGEMKQGIQLRGGHRLSYRLNGFFSLVLNLIGFLFAHLFGVKMSLIADNIMEIVTVAILINFFLSICFYLKVTPKKNYDINPAANQGNHLQDFLLGRSLNPRIGDLDLKLVMFRCSVTGIILLSISVVVKSYHPSKGNYTQLAALAMLIFYIADTMWNEINLLSAREMVKDGFGCTNMMLAVLMPTCYSITLFAIASSKTEQPWYCLLPIGVLFLIGYWIYRGSNSEKTEFRQNPNDVRFKDYETIKTSQGRNLLVSGWWGICRHPNYLGDIILNFALCMPAGFSQIWPYSYAILLAIMLVDRERLDYADCKVKYGEDWDRYCHRVKYRIVPYIY